MKEKEENTSSLLKHVLSLECQSQQCEDGQHNQELSGSFHQQEDVLSCCKKKQRRQQKKSVLHSTPEFQVTNNEMISIDKENTSSDNALPTSPNSKVSIIKILHPDSTSKEKDLLPFWIESKKDVYKQLSWLQKIDWQGSDTNSSSGYVASTERKSWFWTTTITHLPKNSEKTCCPLFKFTVANGMDGEDIPKKRKTVANKSKKDVSKLKVKKTIKKGLKNKSSTAPKEEKEKNVIVKCMKLRLYPNKQQKEMLNKWAGCSRFTYNKVLQTLNQPRNTLRNWMVLRNRYVTARTRNATINTYFHDKPWLLDTPKSIRLEAVKECCKNRKACFSNIMNGNVKSFFMEYKSKRKEQKKGWTIGIEKNNVIRENDQLFIFPSTFGEIRYASTKQLHKLINGKHPSCDPKIQKDRYGDYYMLLPLKVKISKPCIKEHNNVVSVDRGVKIFATLYDPKGVGCFYGKNIDVQFLSMLEALDDMISERDRFDGPKQEKKKMDGKIKNLRKRIMNCKKELHHQFNNFITKNYTLIICPKLDTQKLSLKERRTLRTKTVRSMLNLGHCGQHEKLIHKCKERNVEMISPSEAYTSKTCPMCGQRKDCTSNRMKVCDCGYKAERDLNGALNILLRSIE